MDLNKKRVDYIELNKDFELLSTTVLHQLQLTEKIFNEGWDIKFEEEISKNEKIIASLEATFIEKLPLLLLLYTPKAKELRKLVSCHEVILFIEDISDNLLIIIEHLKQLDLSSSDFKDFKFLISKMFEILKNVMSSTAFSFYKDDKTQAVNVLEKENDIENISRELKENLIAAFQDIPLSGQELLNIVHLNKIAMIIEKITDQVLDIAKATIFVIDGGNIKHKNN